LFPKPYPVLLCEVATLLCLVLRSEEASLLRRVAVARYAGRRRECYFATKHEPAAGAEHARFYQWDSATTTVGSPIEFRSRVDGHSTGRIDRGRQMNTRRARPAPKGVQREQGHRRVNFRLRPGAPGLRRARAWGVTIFLAAVTGGMFRGGVPEARLTLATGASPWSAWKRPHLFFFFQSPQGRPPGRAPLRG